MDNINYAYHYENWHSEATRDEDIRYYGSYLTSHALFPERDDAALLEIGCGMGNLLLALQEKGYTDYAGIDLDEAQVAACLRHGLPVEQADAISYLSKSEKTYDAIFLLDVLEHLEKPSQLILLREIYRSLKETGFLVLTVPNAMTPLGTFFEQIDWTHHCSFSPTSLGFILKNAGFHAYTLRPTHQETREVRLLKKPWIDLYKAEFGLDNPILTPSVMAVCFKQEAKLLAYLEKAPDLMQFAGDAPSVTGGLRKLVRQCLRTVKKAVRR